MYKKTVLIFSIFILFGCASNQINHLSSGVTSPQHIPAINDSIWENVSTWPKYIYKGNLKYQVTYIGYEGENSSIHTFDLSQIDMGYKYSAYYSLIKSRKKHKKKDYEYGPQFGWRPDGTIFLKSMTDEYNNNESIYFYRNKQIREIWLYDSKSYIYMRSLFNLEGNEIGYELTQNEGIWYKKSKEEYYWEGEFVTEKEFNEKYCEFRKYLKTKEQYL